MEELEICKQNKVDCVGYRKGKCNILNNTEFNRACPFYKPQTKKTKYLRIGCCGDCPYYDLRRHKPDGLMCQAHEEGEPTDNYYSDCPLPNLGGNKNE